MVTHRSAQLLCFSGPLREALCEDNVENRHHLIRKEIGVFLLVLFKKTFVQLAAREVQLV
jgi:hypothetical protein